MKAILLSAILVAALATAGCATTPSSAPSVQSVVIPAECPSPTLPSKPGLPIANLRPGAQPDVVIRAYAESLRICAAYSHALEQVLEGYAR